MATTGQPTPLALIEEQEDILQVFRTRYEAVKAFEQELVARTGTREFEIANTVVWDAMFAERDHVVIQFASWIRGTYKPGGLLGQLCARHLQELRAAFGASRSEVPKLHGREPRRVRIDARFPAAAQRGTLDPSDLEALRDAVQTEFKPVVEDRDSFRAHPFERGQKATARLLSLAEIEPYLNSAESLLNDLRLLVNNSTRDYAYLSLTNPAEAAADFVDLLLFGSSLYFATIIGASTLDAKSAYWWERRQAFLVALAEESAAHPDLAFNNEIVIRAVRKRVGTSDCDA
jgi:hypothetical protein